MFVNVFEGLFLIYEKTKEKERKEFSHSIFVYVFEGLFLILKSILTWCNG